MNSENPSGEPTLLLPETHLDSDLQYQVLDVGALVPARTLGETGHYDVILRMAPLQGPLLLLSKEPIAYGNATTIQVSSVLLPHATRGTIWRNRARVAEVLSPLRKIVANIAADSFETLSGAEILDRYVSVRGQRLAAPIELATNPRLTGHFAEDFLETAFIHVAHKEVNYFLPCDVVFKFCFFGSYTIASKWACLDKMDTNSGGFDGV